VTTRHAKKKKTHTLKDHLAGTNCLVCSAVRVCVYNVTIITTIITIETILLLLLLLIIKSTLLITKDRREAGMRLTGEPKP
jgi:nitrogen fixation/metabolism regulation signal transduction histidine kinase